METKSYLASDLVNELGVARSTINDWLSRYADYLEAENRGKRRAYSEKSLEILREISSLRNAGMGSFEIEQQLAARYGLRPEITEEPPEPEAENGNGEDSAALPMIRPAFEAVTNQINSEFGKLTAQLQSLEKERRRLSRRLWLLAALIVTGALLLLLLFAFAAHLLLREMETQRTAGSAEVSALSDSMREQVGVLQAEQRRSAENDAKKLAEVTVLLDRSRADFRQSLDTLNGELAAQRAAFEEKIKQLESAAATRHEAEVIRLKEEFARNQQAKLTEFTAQYETKLAALKKASGESERTRNEAVAAREKAEAEAAAARKEIENLRARVSELLEARVKWDSGVKP